MSHPAVHRTIVAVDVEKYGSPDRTNPNKSVVRHGMYQALEDALAAAGIPPGTCEHTDLGDGVMYLIGPERPKAPFVQIVPAALARTLVVHNASHARAEQIRLRMVLHAGEVIYDEHGIAAGPVIHACRLLDAPPLKAALADSPGVIALITSTWFFEEVVRNSPGVDAATFRARRIDVKETATSGWISRPDYPYHSEPSQLTALTSGNVTLIPRQLPSGSHTFIGRAGELAELSAMLDEAVRPGGPVLVSTVTGIGGIGKTWLAVQWANQNMDRFPDGQLFVDMRGFGPSSEVLSAHSALQGFLNALGVDVARLPADLDGQVAHYRSLLADKRMLILIDNAKDFDQVTPLLPGKSACMVIVTCREWPADMVTIHGAQPMLLGALSTEEALELLTARLGRARMTAEPEAAAQLVASCAGLPLALSIIAGRALAHPDFSLASLAAELRSTSTRLSTLDEEMPVKGVSDVLSWSLRGLDRRHQEVFELLGLAPGPDIGTRAAAQLAGLGLAQAGSALRALARCSLVQEHSPGRFGMHELVRLYAVVRARQDRPAGDHTGKVRRLVAYYLYNSYVADQVLDPGSQPIEPLPPKPPGDLPGLTSHEAAIEWFAAEHANLLAAQQTASEAGWHVEAWQLAWSMHTYHWLHGNLYEDLAIWQIALESARRLGAALALSICHQMLGHACSRLGRHEEALRHHDKAIHLARESGDLASQAAVQHAAADTYGRTHEARKGLFHATEALRLYRLIDSPLREAWALTIVSDFATKVDLDDLARSSCDEALALFRAHGYQTGEAAALDSRAQLIAKAGDAAAALEVFREALALRRCIGNVYAEAETLRRIGDCLITLDRAAEAQEVWREAELVFLAQNRLTEAAAVRSRMSAAEAGGKGRLSGSPPPEGPVPGEHVL